MKFRKKPVVIEAMKFLGGFSVDEMEVEWGDPFVNVISYNDFTNDLRIRTLEGLMRVGHGDFVIKGVEGEFYACKTSVFEKSYEPVEE